MPYGRRGEKRDRTVAMHAVQRSLRDYPSESRDCWMVVYQHTDSLNLVAVAVCLRWGSYFAALVDASRPFSSHAWDENTSHIADNEMARLNIEISAAIQWWLTLKGSDDQRYTELVQRVLTHLPVGQKTVTRVPEGDVLADCAASAMATAAQRAWHKAFLERDLALAREYGIRTIANTVTLLSWRNGPVENVHAGRHPGASIQ